MSKVYISDEDGDVVEIIAHGKSGPITVIAEMEKTIDELILRKAHVDGLGPGTSGIKELRELAREFAKQQGVSKITVFGGVRTTGANPGRQPRPITIDVN